MKKRKILILFITVLLLSGCDAEYSIKFKDGIFYEDVVVITDNEEQNANELLNAESYARFNGINAQKYKKEVLRNDKKVSVKFSTDYSINEYRESFFFSKCYPLVGLHSDDEYYYISASGMFNCLLYDYIPVDNVKIKFFTNHEVTEHNADYIDSNYYIWEISSNNYENKPINIVIDKNKIKEEEKENINKNLVFAIIGIAILLIVLIIRLVGVKNNKT